jgi:hypothetical protein
MVNSDFKVRVTFKLPSFHCVKLNRGQLEGDLDPLYRNVFSVIQVSELGIFGLPQSMARCNLISVTVTIFKRKILVTVVTSQFDG